MESKLASVFTVCVVGFFVGCITVLSGWLFAGWNGIIFGIVLMAVFGVAIFIILISSQVARKSYESKRHLASKITVIAKVHSVWVTDKGRVVAPHEDGLVSPKYHVVLITEQNKRLELETHPSVFAFCLEGSWGYAEIQGDWLGSYNRDAELYAKHSGR